jgi:hypothetical protein
MLSAIVILGSEYICTCSDSRKSVGAIRHRLLLYGEIKDGYYSLNEFGIRYVMEGCSNGLKDKIKRQEEIERLEIETQSFTKKK